MLNKKSQITIFIIIGIILFVTLIILFLFRLDFDKIDEGDESEINANAFLKTCLEEKVENTIEVLLLQGGYINNTLSKQFQFSGEDYHDIAYLCYTGSNYIPCKNQEPLLISHLENETKKDISNQVRECFDKLSISLEKEGYVVDAIYRNFNVSLKEGKVIINIGAKLKLTRNEQTFNYENFEVIFLSKLYDLAIVANEVIFQESKYCHFEDVGYMVLYPNYKIKKTRTNDLSIIYTLLHKESNEKFRFAIRTCVMPPGI
jgi:hypothetical protein